MQLELHVGSAAIGAAIGTVMSLLGALAIGPALFPKEAVVWDNVVLLEALARCGAKQPIYASRVGEIVSLKCNGHKQLDTP